MFPQDTLTESAIEFLRTHRDGPFFLYMSHYFVHDPVHSRCQWLMRKYRRRLNGAGPDSRAAYAAMVETLDDLIGRLLLALQESGIAENTMVVLMSDNGGHPNHTTHAPLRGSKWNLYEGGIRVPLIVRWPERVPAGSICDTVVHGCDLLPTFCDIAQTTDIPASIDGVSLLPLLRQPGSAVTRTRPLVWHFPYYHPERNFTQSPQAIGVGDFVTSQTRPHSAIRQGQGKLLHFYEDDRIELYNIKHDISESHNAVSAHAVIAQELKSVLSRTLSEVGARLPQPRTEDR